MSKPTTLIEPACVSGTTQMQARDNTFSSWFRFKLGTTLSVRGLGSLSVRGLGLRVQGQKQARDTTLKVKVVSRITRAQAHTATRVNPTTLRRNCSHGNPVMPVMPTQQEVLNALVLVSYCRAGSGLRVSGLGFRV